MHLPLHLICLTNPITIQSWVGTVCHLSIVPQGQNEQMLALLSGVGLVYLLFFLSLCSNPPIFLGSISYLFLCRLFGLVVFVPSSAVEQTAAWNFCLAGCCGPIVRLVAWAWQLYHCARATWFPQTLHWLLVEGRLCCPSFHQPTGQSHGRIALQLPCLQTKRELRTLCCYVFELVSANGASFSV